MVSFRFISGLLSQYFLLHINAACKRWWNVKLNNLFHCCYAGKLRIFTWNLVNSSALSSSRTRISLTTCCGRSVNDPKFSTSVPCRSTNSRTLIQKYWFSRHKFDIDMIKGELCFCNLLYKWFGAFVLNVALCGCQQCTNSVHVNATLNKAHASLP